MFPHYSEIKPDVHVRVTSLPVCDSLRDLRENQLGTSLSSFALIAPYCVVSSSLMVSFASGTLVKVSGVITRRTSVFPQLRFVKFNCGKCNAVLGPYFVAQVICFDLFC